MKIEYNADKGLYQAVIKNEGIKVEGFSFIDALYWALTEYELQHEQL